MHSEKRMELIRLQKRIYRSSEEKYSFHDIYVTNGREKQIQLEYAISLSDESASPCWILLNKAPHDGYLPKDQGVPWIVRMQMQAGSLPIDYENKFIKSHQTPKCSPLCINLTHYDWYSRRGLKEKEAWDLHALKQEFARTCEKREQAAPPTAYHGEQAPGIDWELLRLTDEERRQRKAI